MHIKIVIVMFIVLYSAVLPLNKAYASFCNKKTYVFMEMACLMIRKQPLKAIKNLKIM